MALTRPTAYQINTVSTTITDPLIVLNQGSTAANIDIGFIIDRSPSANVAIVWQASSNQFILANTSSSGTTNANITVSNYANLRAGNVLATTITTTNLVGNANVTVTGSMLPSANITYDLGSPTQRWREGWFSGSTIHIGDESLSVSNGKWSFTSKGTTVNMGKNDPFDAPEATLTGNITAANFNFSNGNSIFTTINSTITTANTAMKGYADAITTAWTANATTQLSQITGANAAIVTANTALKGYVDGQITSLVGGAPAILDTLNEIAAAMGNDANLSVTLTNSITGANAAIVTANTAMKGYADAITTAWTANATTQLSQITGANAAITTVTNSVTGANASITGANAAIVTANTALKGYVDGQITTRAALSGAIFTGAVTTTELFVTSPGGDEGGQLNLSPAVTNTTLVGNVTIDVYQNKLRIWEGGGTNRGGYFDITGLATGVGTNLAAGGGGSPGGADTQVQFNNSASFGGALSLHYFTGNGVVLANAAVASTSTTTGALQVSGGIGIAGNVWCGQVYSTNNGNGTNYRIGDDAWLGDVNTADTTQLMGVQNGNNAYLRFGNVGTETLGRAGSGALTWTGTFTAGNINSDNHNYANGTSIITTLSSAISTANTALKGYTDGQITTVSNSVTGANAAITTVSNSVTGANAAIVTANTALKGYVDGQITSLVGGAPAVLDTLNEIAIALGNDANLSVTLTNTITTANTNMKGYVDAANTIQSNQITAITNAVAGANATMVTSVTGTAPVTSSGGKTPAISMAAATASANGYMTSTYASKLDGIAANATNVTNTNQLTNGNAFVTASVTLTTAAQTAITSVGTLTGLTTSGAITSTLATGTAPFTIASTTKVTNLNVDMLDGLHVDTAYNSFGAGTIPVRHSSGYFYSNYFNMTADQTTTAATRIPVETGTDSFLRWQTPAQFITNSKIVDWKNHTAQLTMSGGGNVTFNGTALLWSARVIAIPAENAEYSASGYIDITCPTSGTVVYYNAANATTTVTATAAGIPLAAWEAIYYQVTEGQIYTSDQTKFRVVNYTNSTWSPGPGWLLIASRNGDDSTVRWLPGQKTIPSGGTYYTASDTHSWAAMTAKYADLAEKYVADKNYVPGTVVVFGGNKEITVSSASHDPAIAGVISTNPAYVMNYEVDGLALSVALQGRVPCCVQGPVNKGDCVVSSDILGVAQRLDRAQYLPGCVIGKALEDISDERVQTIEVVVGRV